MTDGGINQLETREKQGRSQSTADNAGDRHIKDGSTDRPTASQGGSAEEEQYGDEDGER